MKYKRCSSAGRQLTGTERKVCVKEMQGIQKQREINSDERRRDMLNVTGGTMQKGLCKL